MAFAKDIIGKKFNYLTAIRPVRRPATSGKGYRYFYIFRCDCGVEKEIEKSMVVKGVTKSCGCKKGDIISKKKVVHGHNRHPLHYAWHSMKARCYRKSNYNYFMYGGKGVTVCDEWRADFMAFYNWSISNGWKRGLQIDKDIKALDIGLEPNLYSPERCQWVTSKDNCNSRSNTVFLEYQGVRKRRSELAKEYGISPRLVFSRLKMGWSVHDALTRPIEQHKKKSKK